MTVLLWVLGLLAVLLLGVCGALFYVASVRFTPKQAATPSTNPVWQRYAARMEDAAALVATYPQSDMTLRSEDGLTLMARFFPAEGDARGCIICMHGYRGSGMQDFGCIVPFYHGLGFDVLVPDQRAHGQSQGRYICFGVKERYDCLGWVRLMDDRYHGLMPIFLDGVSMGAATVLMTAGLPLPGAVRGVIADCGFTSPFAIMDHVRAQRFHVPSFPFMQITSLISRLIAGYGFRDASTLDAMQKCHVPVLFVHGGQDDFVPPQMSRDNYAACQSEKRLIIVPTATHATSYLEDTPLCERELTAFLDEHTKST